MSGSARARVEASFSRMREVDRPEIWIHLAERDELLAQADRVDELCSAGVCLPLAGSVVAVKDNIDVKGMPTTAGCPGFAYLPQEDAMVVARLRAQGAIILGKTNLDQFATGLVGTRSPYGPVRNAWDTDRISGGSSSGSAVAVALGIADLALGTDTAGSGRVPAALNGIVGIKPTPGLIPVDGVVPACRSIDCVTVFARELSAARRAVEVAQGLDAADDSAADGRPESALAARPRLAVPTRRALGELAAGWEEAFEGVVAGYRASGAQIERVDISPMLEAAEMLYGSSFVAERYSAVGTFIEEHQQDTGRGLDSTVSGIILAGKQHRASQLFDDQSRLADLTRQALALLEPFDALLTPTTVGHPTIEQVENEPVAQNARLGRFTNFANLMGMCALAFPAGTVAGLPFGVMLTGRALEDRKLAELARFRDRQPVRLVVFGLHRLGQPLNHELVAAGADFLGPIHTAPAYRLRLLAGEPARPGLVAADPGQGVSVEGELWQLPIGALGGFLTGLPAPMTLGAIQLAGGDSAIGFLCTAPATALGVDISGSGGWRTWVGGDATV